MLGHAACLAYEADADVQEPWCDTQSRTFILQMGVVGELYWVDSGRYAGLSHHLPFTATEVAPTRFHRVAQVSAISIPKGADGADVVERFPPEEDIRNVLFLSHDDILKMNFLIS